MEARVRRTQELLSHGDVFNRLQLVMEELKLLVHTRSRATAAYEAHLGACFFGFKRLEWRMPTRGCADRWEARRKATVMPYQN